MKSAPLFVTRLTSPSALSIPTWILAFAPSVTTAVLHDRNLYGGSASLWLAAAVVGAVLAGFVLWLASQLLGARRPLVVLLLVFALAGCARGFGVGWSAQAFGLVSDPQFEVRVLSGAILAIFWLGVATLIVDGFRIHRHTRMELEERERAADETYRASTAELHALTARADQGVVAQVDTLSTTIDSLIVTDPSSRDSLLQIAEELHDVSANVVRPLSHEAALAPEPMPGPPPRSRALGVIAVDTITVDPFRPGWVAALLFPSILMTAVRGYGFVLGVIGALWIAGMAALLLWCGRHLITPHLRRWVVPLRGLAVIVVWLAAGAASAVPVAWSSTWGVGPTDARAVFGIPLLAYVPITSLGLDTDTRAARIASLTWQTRLVRQGIASERMRLGRFLHGSVQSTLTSTALLIETGLARGEDVREIAGEASRRLRVLVEQTRTRAEQPPIDVVDVLDQIAEVWSRQARVDITVDSSASLACSRDPNAAESVVEIVREAIANSIRHGHATSVLASIESSGEALLSIEIRDDGVFRESASQGFGSVMLDDMCLEWSREPTHAGGTLLRCTIPTLARDVAEVVRLRA
jgi:signal transduction histidine kinase